MVLAVATARAKAEAAQARAAFSKKEIEIKIEKARLEATLDALEKEREAEAALAEAVVMEAAAANLDAVSEHRAHLLTLQSPKQRTEEYVSMHSQLNDSTQSFKTEPHSCSHLPHVQAVEGQDKAPTVSPDQQPPNYIKGAVISESLSHTPQQNCPSRSNGQPYHTCASPAFTTQQGGRSNYLSFAPYHSIDEPTTNLARYLARSQLVSSGLTKFDDRPENYLSWKSSFLNTIDDLQLKAGEEIDLLIKWLGPESSEHALRIKSVNVKNPSAGLDLIWERLEEIYGSPEAIEGALFTKLEKFPKIGPKEHQKLRDLGDLLSEIESAKQEGYLPGLSYLDTARGVHPIIEKLPYALQEKWMMEGSRYKQEHRVAFPPFSFLLEFVYKQAKARNDPSFNLQSCSSTTVRKDRFSGGNIDSRRIVSVNKTDVSAIKSRPSVEGPERQCPVHNKPHPLRKCRGFREMPLDERKRILKAHNICFKCCASNKHVARNCEANTRCSECDSDKHPTVLHPTPPPWSSSSTNPSSVHGGEREESPEAAVVSKCTEVCGEGFHSKSCSKICLVNVYPAGNRRECKRMYVMLDDQSNRSLARSEFFEIYGVNGPTFPYTLKTCSGVGEAAGRRANGFMVESADGALSLPLPTLIECNMIPNNRDEIPTPAAALCHPHLKAIAHKLPALDKNAEILLLLGRDMLRVHKVRRQISGPHDAAYAQRLDLGWVIVGDVCLGSSHRPSEVTSVKTHILENGRPSHFPPCENHLNVKEKFTTDSQFQPCHHSSNNTLKGVNESLGKSVFEKTKNDSKLAPSVEDLLFLKTMENEFFQDSTNSWVAPLPFRQPRKCLPNNRSYAMSRLKSLHRTLSKNPQMRSHFTDFMQKIMDSQHAEPAPPMQSGKEYWYLPFFGVYHPQKPSQIRVVFDSSAQFEGTSLNDVLLPGPNLNNSLLGVLIRFRKNPVAITADIQQMFHCFLVKEDCRDVLRFVWHKHNDLSEEVTDFRMRVHVFGNSPSPAVAIFGLRRAAQHGEEHYGSDVRQFIERDFYVDDALKSVSTEKEAIDLLKRTQEMLATSNLRLHKIASNKLEVMDAFSVEDRAKDLQDLDLFVDDLPDQRSLGVRWNIMSDHFSFHTPQTERPYTRRGVLSTVNSLFDPLGFLAPVTIKGRLLLRELSSQSPEWDSALPEALREKWMEWQNSLQHLSRLHVPRTYSTVGVGKAKRSELHVFSDASEKAICAVAYIKVTSSDGGTEVGFVLGKARLAPQPALTIPRLELCAAVLAVEIAEVIAEEIDHQLDSISFYTDSKVILGYIHNQSRRFYVYVNNRVQRIRESTTPEQWNYVPTDQNPADHGSRSVLASKLQSTSWFTGPPFLQRLPELSCEKSSGFELVDPVSDAEVRPEVKVFSTQISETHLCSRRWDRFSTWKSVTKAVAYLKHVARCFAGSAKDTSCVGWHICKTVLSCKLLEEAEELVIKNVQADAYADELRCISAKQDLSKHSSLIKLNPTVDERGLLRVGGRIKHSDLALKEKNPIILPGKSHVTTLLVRYHHEKVSHQGRHFTEGAIRGSGLWIVGAKRCISKVISKCVTCRKLRGKVGEQLMCDLPADRLQVEPPFTYVGMDVFGPWEVSTRRTRGGQANSKRWAVLFTCLCTRAVHIEVVEGMSSSSFINALRRFFALRGPAKQLRSDCGTNFIGACNEMGAGSAEENRVRSFLQDQKCAWDFNPPHSSHMGGAWERMIGMARRILDCMLLQTNRIQLTHEILTTFLAEVTAILNARPLVPVSSDPEQPHILSPSILLTQKCNVASPLSSTVSIKEMLTSQWKRVQFLADEFWNRWRKEYLATLQPRQKWQHKKINFKDGDVVLLKEKQARRNEWPMGIIVRTVPSHDGLIRKAEVKVVQQGSTKTYYRPISELVLLLQTDVREH